MTSIHTPEGGRANERGNVCGEDTCVCPEPDACPYDCGEEDCGHTEDRDCPCGNGTCDACYPTDDDPGPGEGDE